MELRHLDAERMAARGDKPMTGKEKLDELEWLLDAGTHPETAAAQLGTNVIALEKLARNNQRGALAKRIMRQVRVAKNWGNQFATSSSEGAA